MGNNIVENSIRYITNNFPEVRIKESSSEIFFDGRYVIEARKGKFEIHEAPHLKIVMNKQYPKILPVCYDVDEKVKYDHVFSDNSLCVATVLDLAEELKDSFCIKDYVEKFIIPYFLSYRYWLITGNDINGDRAHGAKGVFESLRDYLCCDISDKELELILCWAAKIKKFKLCVPKYLQNVFLEKYVKYVKKLRLLGIFNLRLQYKLLLNQC